MLKIVFGIILLASTVHAQLYYGPFKADCSNCPPGAVTQNYVRPVTLNNTLRVVSTVNANYFVGNGAGLTNVSASLPNNAVTQNYYSAVTINNILSVVGTTNSTYFVGNGAGLTNLPFIEPSYVVTRNYNLTTTINADTFVSGVFSVSGNAIIGNPGLESSGINIGGITYSSSFKVSDIDGTNYAQTILHRHSTILEPLIIGARSNSDTSSHADVTLNQNLFTIYGTGWAGSNYKLFGDISIGVDNTGTVSNTSSPGSIVFKTTPDGAVSSLERLRISNSGNIGIGTSSPVYLLSVNGTANIGNMLLDTNTVSSTSGPLNITPLSGQSLNVNLGTTGDFAVNTNHLYVDTSTVRVGVGTTAPSTALQVVGTVTATLFAGSGASLTALNASNLSTGTTAVARGGTGTATAFTLGSVVFAGASGVYSQNNARLFWNNTTFRLGINTSTPNTALEVNGTVTGTLFSGSGASLTALSASSLATGTVPSAVMTGAYTGITGLGTLTSLQVDNLNLDLNTLSSTSGAVNIIPLSGQNLNVTLGTTGDFAVNTNQLYVDTSAGFVGIGTASPSYPFVVQGTAGGMGTMLVTTPSFSSGSFANIYLGNTDHQIKVVYGTNEGIRIQSADGIRFYLGGVEASQTEKMRITSAGDVGIGTTAAVNSFGRSLTVKAPSGYAAAEFYGGANTDGGEIDFGGGSNRFASIVGYPDGTSPSGKLGLRTSSSGGLIQEWITITSAGNVGIGTGSPGAALTIGGSGTVRIAGAAAGTGTTAIIDSNGDIRPLTSSRRFKTEINKSSLDYSRVLDLELVQFKYNVTDTFVPIGVIAEDVDLVFREAVNFDNDGNPYSINHSVLIYSLIGVVKDLKKENEFQSSVLNLLLQQVSTLREEVNLLKNGK